MRTRTILATLTLLAVGTLFGWLAAFGRPAEALGQETTPDAGGPGCSSTGAAMPWELISWNVDVLPRPPVPSAP